MNYIAYLSESLNRFTKNKKKLHKERHKTNTAKTLQQTHINSCKQKKSDWQTASQKDYEHMEPTGNTEQCDHVHEW